MSRVPRQPMGDHCCVQAISDVQESSERPVQMVVINLDDNKVMLVGFLCG